MIIFFIFGFHFLQRGLMFHYIHTFIIFKHAEFGKHTPIIRQKLKNQAHFKISSGNKCLHLFFSFFHPRMKFHPCLSSRDEISSRQKRANSKRHFTIYRDDFILGWNFTCKHPRNRDEISSWDETRPGWKDFCLHVSFIQGWNLIWKKTSHWVWWKQ